MAARIAQGAPPHEALSALGAPVRFVAQEQLPADEPYEQFIRETGLCPVRPGLHDFFNGLVWHAFPQSKAALNRLQAAEIARDGIGARRGPVRDAITVFDENGALLQAPQPLWDALLAREWRRLFVELRPLWREARLVIFGHALLEQLAVPRKGLTAHVWRGDAALDSGAGADAWLAARCTAEVLATKPFTPLPVLGIPGWWPGNENFSFYDDSLVFRPRKTPEATTTTTSAGPSRS
ncbi:DUF3025 domain-containing protein [Ramlibacter cellulosilyticus]|uniref:DUF3025 domain-containing protein n=1 Tax=Ramlibacter cellulosilyticus TaxID=2764187 RepID=UPI00338DC35C